MSNPDCNTCRNLGKECHECKEERFLQFCEAYERKSLEISVLSRKLEELKRESATLAQTRQTIRRELVGDD